MIHSNSFYILEVHKINDLLECCTFISYQKLVLKEGCE